MRKLILFTMALLTTSLMMAQKQVKLSGKVVEASTKNPLEYATIVLQSIDNPEKVTGGITNERGNFSVEVPPGNYHLEVQFFSFKTYSLKQINISDDKNLGIISLTEEVEELQGVEVVAKKTTVEMHLDKKIYNVGEDLTVKGGSVTDVLGNVPSISVDTEGNISLRAALAYGLRNEIGFEAICENERELGEYFERELAKIPEVISYCPPNLRRLPIFSFNVKEISPYDFAALLSNDYGIQTRAGCACAGPYGHELLGLKDDAPLKEKPGWVRVSLHYTHTFADIDYLIEAIKKSIEKYQNLWAEERSFYEMMSKKNEGCV